MRLEFPEVTMGQRLVRVNELLKREISEFLHTRYRSESTYITITGVDVSADLRKAKVYYSVLGGCEESTEARKLLKREAREIRKTVGKRIVLKYLPFLEFVYDRSIERGARLNALIDELNLDGESA